MKNKRSVLADILWHPLYPAGTGNRRRIIELSSRCPDFDIRLIGPPPEPHLPDVPYTVLPPASIHMPRLGFNPMIFGYWFPGSSRSMVERVASMNPDIIQAEGLWIAPCAYKAARILRVPWAVTVNNIEHLVLQQRNRRVSAVIVSLLEKRYYTKADLIFAVSNDDATRLTSDLGIPESKIVVVPNGVTPDIRSGTIAPVPHPNVFFMGKTDYPPNAAAIRILTEEWMPHIFSSFPHHAVIVGGPTPPRSQRRITFTGYVEDLPSYLAGADVCVAPLRAGSGTRLKILEYLAAEKPVIATGIAVEGLGLRDGIHYLKAENKEEFALALRRLESEKGLAHRLGRAGKAAVRRFDWRDSAAVWSASLLTLISRSRCR